jgi:hypothetical protein
MKSEESILILVIANKKSQAESTAQMWIKAKAEFGNRPLETYVSVVGEGCVKLKQHTFTKNTIFCLMAEDEEDWKRVTDEWRTFFISIRPRESKLVVAAPSDNLNKWCNEVNANTGVDISEGMPGFKDINGRLYSGSIKEAKPVPLTI